MFRSVQVIGRGRAGGAIAARLEERGLLDPGHGPFDFAQGGPFDFAQGGPFDFAQGGPFDFAQGGPDLVLLCVPDQAIADVARGVPPGPWVAHVSGATPLAALDPHQARFSVHPLQTLTHARGADQLDGAWAAVTGDTDLARECGRALAQALGLRPFDLADDARALYHAGAAIASNYLVTLHRAAVRALEAAGAPPEALVPLMRRVIDNGFDLTGPIARGDWATIDRHLEALQAALPDLEPMYRALADATTR